ncbi:MAG: hypothetical protein JNL67_21870 [Planctomycetaceae bacterium]|nr:hypothetical protein [Planctomycetaceae bacterium]
MRTLAIALAILMSTSCDSSRSATVSTDSERSDLIAKVNLIEDEIARIGEPPKFKKMYKFEQEHFDHLLKLRNIHFLDKYKSLNVQIAEFKNNNRSLPANFSDETWKIFDNLIFVFCVSIHTGDKVEAAVSLDIINQFLMLQESSNFEENWSKILAYRTNFLHLVPYLPEIPTAALDAFHEQCELIELKMPCFWETQIKSVLDMEEPNIEQEKKFLVALLLEAKSLSKGDAQLYYYELVAESNISPIQDTLQVPIPEWLRRLREKAENTDVLKRCVKFWGFMDSLESSHVACIIAKISLESRGKDQNFDNWSSEIFTAIAREYPNAVVTFEKDQENHTNCLITVSLHTFVETTTTTSVLCPEDAFDALPVSYGQRR